MTMRTSPNFVTGNQRELRNSAAIQTATDFEQTASNQTAKLDPGRTTSPDPLWTAKESAAFLGLSLPTFWRRVADRTFPPPVKLGNLSRWPRSEIIAAIEKAKAARYAA